MLFSVIKGQPSIPAGTRNTAYLAANNWDDWRKYRTMFYLTVVDGEGVLHEIGSLK